MDAYAARCRLRATTSIDQAQGDGAPSGRKKGSGWSVMQDDFFLESIYRRFDAAIDRIDSRGRSPTPREADVLTQVLDQIKAEDFEGASELLNTINQTIVASPLVTNTDPSAAGATTTRELRDRMREIRIHPI
jgi:hypothetical protein